MVCVTSARAVDSGTQRKETGPEEGGGAAPGGKDLTQAPGLVLRMWIGAVGYKMGEEGRASDGQGSEFGPHPEGSRQPFEQESEMRKVIFYSFWLHI